MSFSSQLGLLNLGEFGLDLVAVGGATFSETFTASLDFVGTLAETLTQGKVFTSSLSLSGSLVSSLQAAKVFDASLDFSGSLERSLISGLAANFPAVLGFSGILEISVQRGGAPSACEPFDFPATPAFALTTEPEEQ